MRLNYRGEGWRYARAASILLLAVAVVGCGQKTATVSGRVSFNGTPLTGGAIAFHGENGRVDSSDIDDQGNYRVPKAPAGPVKVTVVVTKPVPVTKPPMERPQPKHPGRSDGSPQETPGKPVVLIPEKYKSPDTSGLALELKAGPQTLNIDLKP